MRALTCLLLVTLAVPAHAAVFRDPCNSEAGAKDAAFAAYRKAGDESKAATDNLEAALGKRDQAGMRWHDSMTELDAARGAYKTAMGDLVECQSTKGGGCGVEHAAVDAAKARLQRAKSAEISAFGAFKTACDDLKKAQTALRDAMGKEQAARDKYERAAEVLDKCLLEKMKPVNEPPKLAPKPRAS